VSTFSFRFLYFMSRVILASYSSSIAVSVLQLTYLLVHCSCPFARCLATLSVSRSFVIRPGVRFIRHAHLSPALLSASQFSPVLSLHPRSAYSACSLFSLFPLHRLVPPIPFLVSTPTVTEKILDRDPMEEIRRAFKLFDDDGTGRISLRNLRRVAKEVGDRLEDDEL
jgi:hypothetical protein